MPNKIDEIIKTAHRKRGALNARMTLFKNYIVAIQNSIIDSNNVSLGNTIISELELRIVKHESILNEFEEIQYEIEGLYEDDAGHMAERESFENSYFSLISQAKQILLDTTQNTCHDIPIDAISNLNLNANQTKSNVKLPDIKLPKFCGNYENWLEFRDTFESLIHTNSSIGPIQKYHYLRASLSSSAAQVIHSLEFSANNYAVAWELVCGRYDNRRLLVHNHVKSLFNLSPLTKESSSDVRKMLDDVTKNLRSLQALNQPTDKWDTLIIFIIASKLDKKTSREWEESKTKGELPTLEDLKTFLANKADLLETLELNHDDQSHSKQKRDFKQNSNQINAFYSSNNSNCVFCKEKHNIYNCEKFLKLSVNSRVENVMRLKLCKNCLRPGHFTKNCNSGTCKKCTIKHNTLLHSDTIVSHVIAEDTSNTVSYSSANLCSHQTLLSTAYVQILDRHGKAHNCRALLDSASQSNFITTELCDKLNLQKSKINLAVTGINQISSKINFKCESTILSNSNAFNAKVSCLVISNISENLPSNKVQISHLNIPKHFKLADPNFNEPRGIDLLIGADLFWKLICIGQYSLGKNEPVLQKTLFGWIVSGTISSQPINRVHCSFSKNIEVQAQLEKFWEIEETPKLKHFSNEEKECESHFIDTVKRDPATGRFTVSLPLKESPTELGDSKEFAIKRFYNLERRLQRNTLLKERYIEFMQEYEQMGHMSKINEPHDQKIAYYMPHHGVLREDSLTTKLRVVFDASASTTSGRSINDIQMVGPTIQDSLLDIVLRFRQYQYVVSADIAKMYRQVEVAQEQRSLQRILWRSDPTDTLATYELNTITYGTAAASYLAIRCLHKLADDNVGIYPQASLRIKQDFYVDDLLTGADTIAETKEIAMQISNILSSGCFDLRKWSSNEPKLLHGFEHTELPLSVLEIGSNKSLKTLGLQWRCNPDKLTYNVKFEINSNRVTKRSILSTVAQIFDPLGLLGPCTIVAKTILQALWQHKLSWDESVPSMIHNQWVRFRDQLHMLNEIEVPRRVICRNPVIIEMHGFSDASERAYGACIYIRSIDADGNVHIRLLCAKTKVAPLKCISVPRLELCGALLLAHLANKVGISTTINFNKRYLWCDATIVLGWIRSSPNLLKTFVANRISEIQGLTQADEWNHVNTNDNPADLCSRGVDPISLKDSNIWWLGPSWLACNSSQWPNHTSAEYIEELPELRKQTKTFITSQASFDIFNRYSSLTKLQRVLAFCLRFKVNAGKSKHLRVVGSLNVNDLNNSLQCLIKLAQNECFSQEIAALNKNPACNLKGPLLGLNPFLDKDGLLRVGGRLRLSQLFNYDKKHPILLSSKHILTKLIFKHEHLRMLHASPQALLASIRERFWPLLGRNLAKKTVRSCITCFRVAPVTRVPIMGNLPESRLQPAPPFHVCGVDYAGPFLLKDRHGRGSKTIKCYICLFVCFTTKAVHLELVSQLTAEAFLSSLRRFVSRRGKPLHIYSDNGRNFLGAKNVLQNLGKFLSNSSNEIASSQATIGITWHFIPSHSPHFGGIWEAGIKSTKSHLKRVIGNSHLTFEDFYTVLVQIESILNSRPLSPLSTDPNDLNTLTPSHFLIGKSITGVPDPNLMDIKTGRLNRFQLMQQLTQHFWKRWSKEYVSELQQRTKWKKNHPQLVQVGAMVIIKEDNLPPLKWQLARITELHPGADSVVRVVSVKLSTGVTLKRAIVKICVLPIEKD